MVPSDAVLIAFFVLVVVLCLASLLRRDPDWGRLDYWKAHFVDAPDAIYARTAGGLDAAARLAYARSAGVPRPALADHERAARIAFLAPLSADAGLTVSESFRDTAAERRRLFNAARGHILAAAAARAASDDVERDADGAAFADLAARYAATGAAELVDADPAQLPHVTDGRDADLAGVAAQMRERATRARARLARAPGRPPGGVTAAYIELCRRRGPDPQSALDPCARAGLRRIARQLGALATQSASGNKPSESFRDTIGGGEAEDAALRAIEAELVAAGGALSRDPASGRPRPALVGRAVAVLRLVRARACWRARAAGLLDPLADDAAAVRAVWARRRAPGNDAAAVRQALFDALLDCWAPGIARDEVQCAAGRVARIYGALAGVDAGCSEGAGRLCVRWTLAEARAAIFAEAGRLVAAAAAERAATSLAARARLATSWAGLEAEYAAAARPGEPAAAARRRVAADEREHLAFVRGRLDAWWPAAARALPPYLRAGVKKEVDAAVV